MKWKELFFMCDLFGYYGSGTSGDVLLFSLVTVMVI